MKSFIVILGSLICLTVSPIQAINSVDNKLVSCRSTAAGGMKCEKSSQMIDGMTKSNVKLVTKKKVVAKKKEDKKVMFGVGWYSLMLIGVFMF